MQRWRSKSFTSNKAWLLVFLVLPVIFFTPKSCLGELTVDAFCQLHVQTMQELLSKYQAALSSQPSSLDRAGYEEALEKLYLAHNTTEEEYIMYMGKHERGVNSYLAAHPSIKNQIESLSAQIKDLMERYDSSKRQ
jgi:hypothetical protein